MLEAIAQFAVLVFVVSCMATAGLGLRPRDLLAAVGQAGLLARVLAANFVISPILAYGLSWVFPLGSPYAVGLLLLGAAAGAPFLPKLAALARGDMAFSVGLMLVLTLGSVVFVPAVLPWLLPGLSADWWAILRPLLVTMLLPMAIAMAVRNRSNRWADRLQRVLGPLSNISLLLAVVLLVGLNLGVMADTFGSGAGIIAAVYVTLCWTVGYVLGGPAQTTRAVLGLGTGQRNIAAALVIATQNGNNPGVIAMLLVATLIGVAVLIIAARLTACRSPDAAAPEVNRTSVPEPLVATDGCDRSPRPVEATP